MNSSKNWNIERGLFFWRAVYKGKTKTIKGPRRLHAKTAWSDLLYLKQFTKQGDPYGRN